MKKLEEAGEVQYYHHNKDCHHNKFTVAVNVNFTRTDLEDLIFSRKLQLKTDIGAALCHPNDAYEKSIGRNISFDNMKESMLDLVSIVVEKDSKKLVYTLENNSYRVCLRTSLASQKPHLISVELLNIACWNNQGDNYF